MRQLWDNLLERFEQRAERERWMILGVSLALICAVFDVAWIGPQSEARKKIERQFQAARSDFEQMKILAQEVSARWEVDPDRASRRRQAELVQQIAELDQRLEGRTEDLIPPERMATVLQGMLARGGDLELIRLESLPAEPLALLNAQNGAEKRVGDEPASQLYRHGFVLEFRGGYEETLRYLRAIEDQSWRLFWDGLRFEVIEYPEAHVKIELHTLSQREGWIGV
jgi:MSHA biogenesis protein MshJ